jgi:hypothetical protein
MKDRLYNFRATGRRKRPAGPGASIGHVNTRGGTLGAVVKDKKSGALLILSNNHVLANCSSGTDGRARAGDPIFQPSIRDGGIYSDIIARLYKWVPLVENEKNLVDAAVAIPLSQRLICSDIQGVGRVKGVAFGKAGMEIKKVGRTSGLTFGEIIEENYETTITFEGKKYVFSDQLVASLPCREGDSGSIVLDSNNRAVGLLFAAEGGYGVINRIQYVIELLGIEFI